MRTAALAKAVDAEPIQTDLGKLLELINNRHPEAIWLLSIFCWSMSRKLNRERVRGEEHKIRLKSRKQTEDNEYAYEINPVFLATILKELDQIIAIKTPNETSLQLTEAIEKITSPKNDINIKTITIQILLTILYLLDPSHKTKYNHTPQPTSHPPTIKKDLYGLGEFLYRHLEFYQDALESNNTQKAKEYYQSTQNIAERASNAAKKSKQYHQIQSHFGPADPDLQAAKKEIASILNGYMYQQTSTTPSEVPVPSEVAVPQK